MRMVVDNGLAEELFTSDELLRIARNALDPVLRNPRAMVFPSGPTSVLRVTARNHLVLAQGNDDTGFTHICNRHNDGSRVKYWKGGKLKSTTPFSDLSIPILDYAEIADFIYEQGFGNNSAPDKFDSYQGTLAHGKWPNLQYRLLLYKGTRVVHSLYPLKSVVRGKQLTALAKGDVRAEQNEHGEIRIIVPYCDEKGLETYRFVVRRAMDSDQNEYLLEVMDSRGGVREFCKLGVGKAIASMDAPLELHRWSQMNLTSVERIIEKHQAK